METTQTLNLQSPSNISENPSQQRQREAGRNLITWLWQSGVDPWAETDPSKRRWEPYSQEISLCIEKNFLRNQSTADIGDYIIDFKKMVQINKQDKNKIRRVLRQTKSELNNRFMVELPQPTNLPKEQKTINTAFGDVRLFLNYITKRTYESYILYLKLKRLPLDTKKAEYPDIIEKVVNCVRKGAIARENIVQNRDPSANTNFQFEADCIIEELNNNSDDLGSFLRTILKIYTMETFICYWLNELLRSESWEEINILTPFLVCLTFTFQLEGYIIPFTQKRPSLFDKILSFLGPKQNKLILYRGTALTDEHLAIYRDKKVDYFSWNGVTSTSRNKEQSMNFINNSLMTAKTQNITKTGVLFVIETELLSTEDCHGMIDVSANSRFPHEEEVILAPGTIFKVMSAKQRENNVWQINLEIQKKLENEKEAIAILGALQKKIITRDDAKLDGLSGQELIDAIQLLEGNQYIEALEIKNIKIDDKIAQMMNNMLKTTTRVKSWNFHFRENEIIVDSLGTLDEYFGAFRLVDEILGENDVKFEPTLHTNQRSDNERKMKNLYIGPNALGKYSKNNQLHILMEQIQNETKIESFSIYPRLTKLDQKAQTDLMACITSLPLLKSIRFNFDDAVINLDQTFDIIKQSFASLNSLTGLAIQNFFVGPQGFKSLIQILDLLPTLKQIHLFFGTKTQISDEGVMSLMDAMKKRSGLEELNLNFSHSKNVTDQSVFIVCESLSSFSNLQSLSLDFSYNENITDQGLEYLEQSLESLLALKTLKLNLYCHKLSLRAWESLEFKCKSIKTLTSKPKILGFYTVLD